MFKIVTLSVLFMVLLFNPHPTLVHFVSGSFEVSEIKTNASMFSTPSLSLSVNYFMGTNQ